VTDLDREEILEVTLAKGVSPVVSKEHGDSDPAGSSATRAIYHPSTAETEQERNE
jgi:hypothetical protein